MIRLVFVILLVIVVSFPTMDYLAREETKKYKEVKHQ